MNAEDKSVQFDLKQSPTGTWPVVLFIAAIVGVWLLGANPMTVEGLITTRSKFGPAETVNRLAAAVNGKGLIFFARVDHADGANEVGLSLPPTELLIFGNAKGGTPLMQSVQTIGIDLPLKVLVWEDSAGVTWLSYNDPHWLAKRHSLDSSVETSVVAMATVLNAVVTAAAGSPS